MPPVLFPCLQKISTKTDGDFLALHETAAVYLPLLQCRISVNSVVIGHNLAMSQIVGNLTFQFHLQNRGQRMHLHLVSTDPQGSGNAAPGQRTGIAEGKLLPGMENADLLYPGLHTLHTQELRGLIIDKEIDGLFVCRKSANSKKLI